MSLPSDSVVVMRYPRTALVAMDKKALMVTNHTNEQASVQALKKEDR